jgi:predicted RNase H-like nuclease (RuvC/YqgF family)
MRILIIMGLALTSGGCLRTVADVVTAPVKVVSKTADVLTTSQSEADEKRGRALRQREERLGKLERKRSELTRKCERSEEACNELDAINAEIRAELERDIKK